MSIHAAADSVVPFCFVAEQVPLGFPGDSVAQNTPASARDVNSAPGLGRPPGEGRADPLQDSCLGDPVDRGAWRAAVHGLTKESDAA